LRKHCLLPQVLLLLPQVWLVLVALLLLRRLLPHHLQKLTWPDCHFLL
jgi:hypothetical protein